MRKLVRVAILRSILVGVVLLLSFSSPSGAQTAAQVAAREAEIKVFGSL